MKINERNEFLKSKIGGKMRKIEICLYKLHELPEEIRTKILEEKNKIKSNLPDALLECYDYIINSQEYFISGELFDYNKVF